MAAGFGPHAGCIAGVVRVVNWTVLLAYASRLLATIRKRGLLACYRCGGDLATARTITALVLVSVGAHIHGADLGNRMRYSLRTLLIVMTVACMYLAWVGYCRQMGTFHRQQSSHSWAAMAVWAPKATAVVAVM